jgi:hypothetical protein
VPILIHSHPLCLVKVRKKKKTKKKKIMKEKKKKEKPKVNLILSHANHTFEKLDPQINGPQAFGHTHCTLQKSAFLNVKKGPIQGSIKLVPGFLVLGPLSKLALMPDKTGLVFDTSVHTSIDISLYTRPTLV